MTINCLLECSCLSRQNLFLIETKQFVVDGQGKRCNFSVCASWISFECTLFCDCYWQPRRSHLIWNWHSTSLTPNAPQTPQEQNNFFLKFNLFHFIFIILYFFNVGIPKGFLFYGHLKPIFLISQYTLIFLTTILLDGAT